MKTLNVELTDDQYQRFKAAMQKLCGNDVEVTDNDLVAQLKREASAVTYAAENESASLNNNWSF